MAQIEKRDLVLPPGAFAYMQDVTTGMVKTFVGPCVINQTAQELPVIYDPRDKRFRICSSLEEAVCKVPVAVEGSYLVLLNPAVASGEEHPQPGNSGKPSPSLQVGRKINIPGPVMFALWPGQEGKVVKGHHLRSNQYLIARVYNEEEARKNWPRAVVKGAEEETTIAVPADLTVGRQIVIKGTEVSFYMPPTGVSVVVDEKGSYVREALTLERLEYAILIDEDGNKRYERGPQVVFPEPTEQFAESGGQIKFRAVELNEIQGLHIKVIAPYNDGIDRKEGDELFLTGRDVQIYFPREEHAIIKYDGAAKHFATAVPVGEGRYVMNRLTGEIETVRGPNMLLPDPRTRVIVRRVLSDRECGMWYPDNTEVREYNANLRQVVSQAPTTRSGVVSEGDYARHAVKGRSNLMKGAVAYSANMAMEESRSTRDQRVVAEELSRNASYTEPRTITLSSRLAGVPGIEVWPGYAVLVKNKTGARRVVVGPASILLDYDETLEVMELSTGKPKTTDHLLRTVFLKHAQNLVTDIISGVETTDHFTLTIKLQFRAKFTGDDKLRWFEGGNYVKLLCDHVRSMVKARVRGFNLRDFYGDSEKILRDIVLGAKPEGGGDRPGLHFEENGLSVYELEVLSVNIEDEDVQELLVGAQQQTMRDTLEVEQGQRHADTTIAVEEINRRVMGARTETELVKAGLNEQVAAAGHAAKLQAAARLMEDLNKRIENEIATREHDNAMAMSRLETEKVLYSFSKSKSEDELARTLEAERQRGALVVERLKAISPELSLALTELLDERKMAALIEAFGGLASLKLKGVLDTAQELFDFVPSEKMQIVSQRKRAGRQAEAPGNGK